MKKIFTGFNLLVCSFLLAQNNSSDLGTISGNFQSDFQYYIRDTLIDPSGEADPDERMLGTGFLNLTYSRGNFIAGIRYENYQNQRVGLPAGYNSEGITYRYARFIKDRFDVTVGNFYEQFGSGLTLRTYEERGLGIDNNLDGIRMAYQPADGVTLKAVIGRQRNYFDKGAGLVRGFDAEWSLKPTLGWTGNTNLIIGGSFVSKFEAANDPELNLPENVGTGAIRVNLITGDFNIFGEYAYKSTDPNSFNDYIFKPGEGIYIATSYANNGLGVSLGFKRYDNFFFKSQRESDLQQLFINYLPSLTTLHTYTLPALYSFNTQGNGEMGFQGEVSYNFKRNTLFGGKYGTLVTVSYANSYSLDKDYKLRPRYSRADTTIIDSVLRGSQGYSSSFLGRGPYTYFQDLHIEFKKKLSKKWKATATYYNFVYNNSTLIKGASDYDYESVGSEPDIFFVNAGVLELLYKIKSRHALRTEIQGLFTEQDRGNWALLLMEYSIAPSWFFAIQDAYNYGNPDEDLQIHYISANVGYSFGTTRFQMGYGRQQQGVFCVGGICRIVPASNGFTFGVTTNF
ncbi:MAG: DUF6029 family protein [Owenweeksia sp.]